MIPVSFQIRDRGPTPRGMRKAMNAATAAAWAEAGTHFHEHMRFARFTHAHATKAGYAKRSAKYEREKLRKYRHTYPLEYSGDTRRRTITEFRVVANSKGVHVRYPGARKFNFRNPASSINMAEEFTRILPEEATVLAGVFDKALDRKLNAYNGANQP